MSLNARSYLGQTWVKPLSAMLSLNIYLCPTAHMGVLDIGNDTLKSFYSRIYQLDSFVYLITVHPWDCLEQNRQHWKQSSTLRGKTCVP